MKNIKEKNIEKPQENKNDESSANKFLQWIHKVQNASPDVETGQPTEDGKIFNPFLERNVANPTTDGDTLTHLLKASLGTGILAMPVAFKNAGLFMGIIATLLVAFVCTHCSYILVKCAHVLYFRTRRTEMSFADVAEAAFATGPIWSKKFATSFRYFIQICLFVTYFGASSVYAVIITKNFQQVLEYYTQDEMNERLLIASLLVPIILLCLIPNLKYLAPVSMVANVLMGISLGITFYYLVMNLHPLSEIPKMAPVGNFPTFFSITIFAMEAIGVMMPLENSMKTPQNFVGIFGVLNKGMAGVTIIYILLGFLGYCAYPDNTADSITLNLPINEIPAQIVKIFIGLAVFCTFSLQFYVCIEIGWNAIKDRFEKKAVLANYILRSVLATGAVLLAVAVPTIGPFIGLIGAFCFSILGLLVPVIIEIITFWNIGFGPGNWIVWKNSVICIVGFIALAIGSKSAIADILAIYYGGNVIVGETTMESVFNSTSVRSI